MSEEGGAKTFYIVLSVLVAVIIAIVLVKKFYNPQPEIPTVEYNHFTFANVAGSWYWDWKRADGNVFRIPLRYNPYEVENVTVEGTLAPGFSGRPIYVTFDPRANPLKFVGLASAELSISIGRVFGLEPKAGCAAEGDLCDNVPHVSCSGENSVIIVREAQPAKLVLNNTCIIVQGDKTDITRVADRLLYQWYGVMK
ncbi:hypothetical protein HY642_04285 [Candidatus Woesearchaeota archaeon]|nr:hypothetical protein [Candidatus Woesearchaeota archaeon]